MQNNLLLFPLLMTALVKPVTWVFGVVFLLIGLLGFFSSPILGFFDVNTLHNVIHLASGAAALIAAGMGIESSRTFLIVFGIVYLLVAVLGFLGVAFIVDLLALNSADNLLHLAIAAVTLAIGFGSKE